MMKDYLFKVKDGKLVNGFYREGLNSLCAIVETEGSLMKYGEENICKEYYMQLLKMYSKMNNRNTKECLDYFGLPSEKVEADIMFIRFNDLAIDNKYKAKLMNYMIEVSLNGKKVKELLEGTIEDLKLFLDRL